tara:strand:+ start:1255 stop:1548 length:294 start_codon:yes stop_codon:yes gene_type:complete
VDKKEVDIIDFGTVDMDKEMSIKIDFTTLIVICTSLTMYSEHVSEMISNEVLPSPIGETMLENVDKVIDELHHIMSLEGNEIYKALYQNIPKGGNVH